MSKVGVLFILSALQAIMFVLVGNSILEIKGMYLEYWLILFSAWCFSNVLGLLISDSFKTIITIYILIPFLIIPQLILSGVIVKYEKLNPTISNPKNIPFYGEIITARWAYEALAVYQFKNNEYEENFYSYDKTMSRAEFKKNYWIPSLQNKVSYCKRNLNNPDKEARVKQNLTLIRNELREEQKNRSASVVDFSDIGKLYYDQINSNTFESLNRYLSLLKRYYIKLYNKANAKKDAEISEMQSDTQKRERFLELKRAHYNEKLADFVKNSNEVNRIIEYDGELIQKIDPVFMDPDNKFVKAHFYAPRKQVFGNYYDTFWVNFVIIWAMSILLYIMLYYRLLRRFLDFLEVRVGVQIKKPPSK